MSSGIYKIHNILNNKVYVGQSLNIERRWESHINKLNKNNHHNAHLQSAWNKYSKNNFVFTIIEICTNDINNREIFWINYYDSFYNGYNLTRGGEGKPEYKVSEETKRKISHSLRGENAYSVIINDSKAKEIKLLIIDGYELNDIVRITGGGVNKNIIRSIKKCKSWVHILPELNEKLLTLSFNYQKILSVKDVEEIKICLINNDNFKTIEKLAHRYNVSVRTINSIKCCQRWQNVAPELNDKLKNKINNKQKLSDETINNIKSLVLKNFTEEKIAQELGISRSSVSKYKK